MAALQKPVKLQVNTNGAWKNVICFDAADESACAKVFEAADILGRIDGRITFRVSIDDALSETLYRWSKEHGWKAVTHA